MPYHFLAIAKFVGLYLLGLIVGMKVKPAYIYLLCTAGFLVGFALRALEMYPGRYEPLFIDFSTMVICLVLFSVSEITTAVPVKYGLLGVISVHIVYNVGKVLQGVG